MHSPFTPPSELELFHIETEHILDELAQYHALMEAQLESDKEAFHSPDKEKPTYVFWDAITHLFTFPRFLRYSIVFLLYSILENQLGELCNLLYIRRKLLRRPIDIEASTTLARFKQYLCDEVGIRIRNEQLWEKIEDLAKVRNRIGHSIGKTHSTQQRVQLQQIANETDGVDLFRLISTSPEVHLLPEYCSQSITNVSLLFRDIMDGLEDSNTSRQ